MASSKFQKGISGNPKGRAPGQTPGAKLRKAIEARSDDILNTVIASAVNGDMTACKMLLDRFCPALKPIAQPINLPVMESLSGQGEQIIRGIMTGKVAPDIGSMLVTALANQAKLVELQELEARISALEEIKK